MAKRLSWRDLVASILIAVLVLIYVVFLIVDRMPWVVDNGDMAGVGLGLGFAACVIGGSFPPGPVLRGGSALSALAIALAVAVMASESSWLLAVFITCVVVLWVSTTVLHARFGTGGSQPVSRSAITHRSRGSGG